MRALAKGHGQEPVRGGVLGFECRRREDEGGGEEGDVWGGHGLLFHRMWKQSIRKYLD